MIRILAVGKRTDRNLVDAIESYQKRLKSPFNVEWALVPYSAKEGAEARREESRVLLGHLKDSDKVILLDEQGNQMDNIELSRELSRESVTIIIGGAYGVDDELRHRADTQISLSSLIFPHQIVRLILIEQIYRSQAIYYHHPYHHV